MLGLIIHLSCLTILSYTHYDIRTCSVIKVSMISSITSEFSVLTLHQIQNYEFINTCDSVCVCVCHLRACCVASTPHRGMEGPSTANVPTYNVYQEHTSRWIDLCHTMVVYIIPVLV